MSSSLAKNIAKQQLQSKLAMVDQEAKEKEESNKKKITNLVIGGSTVAVGCAAVSLGTMTSQVSNVASIGTLGLAPYAIFQRKKAQNLDTYRKVMNDLRGQVNEVTSQNDELTKNINNLTTTVSKLQDIEKQLDNMVEGSEYSVNQLVEATKQNELILKEIKNALQSDVLSTIMSVVLSSDRNKDLILDEMELEILMVRLDQVNGMIFHEDKFRYWVQNETETTEQSITFKDVMGLCQNLLDDNVPAEKSIFELDLDALQISKS